jgi:hypothetical protein
VIRFVGAGFLVAMLAVAAGAVEAQEHNSAELAYFRAVARYFELPEGEVAILSNWDVPPDEIPVLLFFARRGGVSAEALVALRESGRSWMDLSQRYRIGARALHVPVHDMRATGRLEPLYSTFRDTPVDRWADIRLSSDDIVALVNVRVLSQSLGLSPDEIMRRTAGTSSFVELYAQLLR